MSDLQKKALYVKRPGLEAPVIAIDIYHGIVFPGAGEFLGNKSFLLVNEGEVRLLNYEHLTDELLANTTLLSVTSMAHTSRITFTEDDTAVIERYVSNGGNLLCAGQAWSWVYPSYGNQPEATFPLNALGRRFGFTITGRNIGGPVVLRTDITGSVEIITRRGWWPSEITFSSGAKYVPFIKDAEGRVMAAYTRHKKGCVVVVGHESMFDGNPQLLLSIGRFMFPQFPGQEVADAPARSSAAGDGGPSKK